MLITDRIEKIKKNSKDFFKSLKQFFLKYNGLEVGSKLLVAL